MLIFVNPALAVRPDEMLPDPAQEARARDVSKELRCLVCRNQSLDDSDADLAHDLRVLVRERIKAGDSNDQVLAYVRARYGDFVLLRPPFQFDTLLLWGGPLLILVIGGFAVRRYYRGRSDAPTPPPLSEQEQQRLQAVLAEEKPGVSLGLAIALMGMTTLAVAILLVPLLLRQRFGGSREAYNLTVYRDQLAEIGRDIDRGVLTAEQAEAARAEIGRRILALNPAEQPAAAATSPAPFAVAIIAVIALPFAAWTIYAALGSPGVPDQPYAARGKANPATTTAEASPPHDMSEILGRLRKHLAEQPTDVNGWLLLARSTMSLDRFAGGRRRLSACRRTVGCPNARGATRYHRRLGRGAGTRRGRRRDAASARGLRENPGRPRERAALALLPGARGAAAR